MEYTARRKFLSSVDDVWNIVGDFARCDEWCPVDVCDATGAKVGDKRTLIGRGLHVEQELTELDNERRTISYTMKDTAQLPWRNYLSTIALNEETDGCEIIWSCWVDPLAEEAEVKHLIEETFEIALENLVAKLATGQN